MHHVTRRRTADLQTVVFFDQLFLGEQVLGLDVLQTGRPLLTLQHNSKHTLHHKQCTHTETQNV